MPALSSLYDARFDGAAVTRGRPLPVANHATSAACGATLIEGGEDAVDLLAADAAASIRVFNSGPEDARLVLDGEATGASTERLLRSGDDWLVCNGARLAVNLSVFAASDTTILWETWS